jgi:hypothetical protein
VSRGIAIVDAVARERLLEAVRDWEGFTCAVVTIIYGLCNSVRMLQLTVFTSRVLKWSINLISNPKPRL